MGEGPNTIATGRHNRNDAISRVAAAFLRHCVAWSEGEGGNDDVMDGLNVDAFCAAAFSLFQHSTRAVYNIRGEFKLSQLLPLLQPGVSVERVAYKNWHEAATSWCRDDSTHSLAALMPHIDPSSPPLTSAGPMLSTAGRAVIGRGLTETLLHCRGFGAFAKQLREDEFIGYS